MGAWYTVGVMFGLGTAVGIAVSAAVRRLALALVVALVVAVVIGAVVWGWPQAAGGLAGAAFGVLGTMPVVAGTLRRGGTRGGTAMLLGGAALGAAVLAFVPVLGYLEAIAVLILGTRLRRRTPDTHAGLRTLARD
ncbi:MAG TPA: hypothetical protein VF094_07115 [Gaiellaceae bacterium]